VETQGSSGTSTAPTAEHHIDSGGGTGDSGEGIPISGNRCSILGPAYQKAPFKAPATTLQKKSRVGPRKL
jgi:hypothetical protein